MKIILIIVLVVFLTFPAGASAQDRYMGEAMFEGTMDQYVQGNYEAAVRGFLRYLEMNPSDFNGQYLLARSYLFLGDEEHALERFNKALEINPADIEANIFAGRLLLNKEDIQGASNHFLKVLDQLPNDAETLALMGLVENAHDNAARAREYCQRSLEIDPGRLESLVTYARILFSSGNKEEAAQYLDKARKTGKLTPDILIDMAVLYETTGHGITADSLITSAASSDSTVYARYRKKLEGMTNRIH